MNRYDENYYSGEEAYYGNQKLGQRSFWRRYRWFILALGALTVLVVLLASSTLYLLTNRTSVTAAPSAQGSSSQPLPATPAAQAGANAPTSIPPTATPALKTLTKNISIPCVSSDLLTCNDTAMDVQLVSIVADSSYGPQGRLICNFTLTNRGPGPSQVDGGPDDFAKARIFLQGPTGSSTDADGGTLLTTSDFTPGASLPLTITFPLIPQSGVAYLLNIKLGISRDDYPHGFHYSAATYQTLSLTV